MVLGRLLASPRLPTAAWLLPGRVYRETTPERLPAVAAPEPRLAVVLAVAAEKAAKMLRDGPTGDRPTHALAWRVSTGPNVAYPT
jgi:hypothetical protein